MGIVIHKFGGASVKDAKAVDNVSKILARKEFIIHQQFIVVSAMGKTTNQLENIWELKLHKKQKELTDALSVVFDYHKEIIEACFLSEKVKQEILTITNDLLKEIPLLNGLSDNQLYDAIVSRGEIISTQIISFYLKEKKQNITWLDARAFIKTNNARPAEVSFKESTGLLNKLSNASNYVIGGFIGSSSTHTTTLGREGSDYTASIIAHCLNAKKVYIWKDVPGVLNADPKRFNETIKIREMSYEDAVEISYYGASVIHPRTVQPLKNKEIPLFIKSFIQSEDPGTFITKKSKVTEKMPYCYIIKENQKFLSIVPKDFSFINEGHLNSIYKIFKEQGTKLNLSQHSAVRFNACIDASNKDLRSLLLNYDVSVVKGLKLITITYFNETILKDLIGENKVLLLQKTNHIARVVIQPKIK